MIRVHVICEGQTEEMFVNELLQPLFSSKGIYLYPSLIGKPGHKGGNFKFERLYTDVKNRLLGERDSYCTTFFDYYGLPTSFPGKNEASVEASIQGKAAVVKEAMHATLTSKLGETTMRRFIPFIQMYEFKALLFSNPQAFARGIGREPLIQNFEQIVADFATPEHINDSPQTAPSKRIENLIPGYEKPLMGNLAAIEVGLDAMRNKCVLFNNWLVRLEGLSDL